MSGKSRQHHKPVLFTPLDFEPVPGGADPARICEAAHLAAHALVHHGRASDDPEITERLVKLTDEQGLEAIAELWSSCPAHSLPGALWRLYALRATIHKNPQQLGIYFREGMTQAQVPHVVAGVADPPGAQELSATADAILAGAFDGDFGVALERAAAFCRVVALGQAQIADTREITQAAHAQALTRSAQRLLTTAEDLEAAARSWRRHELD